jgi:four helix bundle protein
MTDTLKGFNDLRVWQKAMDLTPEIYQVVRKLPAIERFALADQLRRAAISLPSNIAEGQARQHSREFLQHLSIARASLAEMETLLLLAVRLAYITQEDQTKIQQKIRDVRMPLSGLINRLQSKQ